MCRTTVLYGEADVFCEETGKGNRKTSQGRGPDNNTKTVEIMSGSCATSTAAVDLSTKMGGTDQTNLCVTARRMKVGPSQSSCRRRLQTASSCCGQKSW